MHLMHPLIFESHPDQTLQTRQSQDCRKYKDAPMHRLLLTMLLTLYVFHCCFHL